MMNPASTSDPSCIIEVYPYPSQFVAPNFVTMKLSGKDTYNVWETQMLCLLKSHHMFGFIDGKFPNPAGNGKSKEEDIDAWIASDSLVKCWILGTLSDGVAKKVVNRLGPKDKKTDFSAKDLWDELQRSYGPSETKLTTRQAGSVSEDAISNRGKREVYNVVLIRNPHANLDLEEYSLNPWDKLTNNGNTVLQVAVGSSTKNHELLNKLLEMTPKENTLIDLININGSTLLHVAAIGGRIQAVNMLVERNPELLLAKDKDGHTPLALSVSNMHIKTSECLFEHMKEKGYHSYFTGKSGEEIVVLAISCQDFSLAEQISREYPRAILSTTLAQNFPRELNLWERRDFLDEVEDRKEPYKPTLDRTEEYYSWLLRVLLLYFIMGFLFLMSKDSNIVGVQINVKIDMH